MTMRYNPFKPNSPVYQGMFAGRYDEILEIEKALFQTKNGNPVNIMIVGERGIGKSSLLMVSRLLASEEINDIKNNFLTVRIGLTGESSIMDLAYKIQLGIERELNF